ncbi:MAG: phosphomethylpyrimidine synthase, partial [Bacteroidales bacterium]|nr:phosphomethylpyrimidine synthase [Bacteroidales bacterium]
MNKTQDICNAFDASEKVYVEGKIHPIKVGMRKVSLTDTIVDGKAEKNGDVLLYDTSGFYTDPNVKIDIKKGLPRFREEWLKNRKDLEKLTEYTSKYSNLRLEDES